MDGFKDVKNGRTVDGKKPERTAAGDKSHG